MANGSGVRVAAAAVVVVPVLASVAVVAVVVVIVVVAVSRTADVVAVGPAVVRVVMGVAALAFAVGPVPPPSSSLPPSPLPLPLAPALAAVAKPAARSSRTDHRPVVPPPAQTVSPRARAMLPCPRARSEPRSCRGSLQGKRHGGQRGAADCPRHASRGHDCGRRVCASRTAKRVVTLPVCGHLFVKSVWRPCLSVSPCEIEAELER